MNWLSCRNQPRAGRFPRGKSYFAADSRWIRAASNFIRLVSRPGTRAHTRGSETVCSNCTVSCKHTYEPATRVYGPGYYLLPGRDINHGYPCGVSASTFCIKRNETRRNGCLRKGNSLGFGELCVVTGGENWNSWAKKLYFMFRRSFHSYLNHEDLASTRNLFDFFIISYRTFLVIIQTVAGILITKMYAV